MWRPPSSSTSASFLTRVSSRVHRSAEQQNILCERGVEETHGAHPASSIHKHPLQVLVRQNVTWIPDSGTHRHFQKKSWDKVLNLNKY